MHKKLRDTESFKKSIESTIKAISENKDLSGIKIPEADLSFANLEGASLNQSDC